MINFFKKKEIDDELSEFSTDKYNDNSHLGLPLDGDMTNTGNKDEFGNDPFSSSSQKSHSYNDYSDLNSKSSVTSPGSFQEFNKNTFARQESSPVQNQNLNTNTGYNQNTSSPKLDSLGKDMEILDAKIDSIKVMLESLSQRMVHIERMVEKTNDTKW
jgi:hypothetical protein